jgi:two-component sensor histidine kinase
MQHEYQNRHRKQALPMKSTSAQHPFPWRFWLIFTFWIGVGPALGSGVAASARTKSVELGVLVGILAAVVSVAIGAIWYRSVMRKRDPNFTFNDAAARAETNVELPVSADEAFTLCVAAIRAVPGYFPKEESRASLVLTGVTGGGAAGYLSFGAPGEKLHIHISSVTANSSRAFVRSQPGTAMVVLDFGKNRQNIRTIVANINAALQRRFDEAREQAERAEMQRALTAAKLNALQAQIEPHFLYNTLANAQSLTRTDARRADEMLGNLITFLRASLTQHNDGMSTIEDEFTRTRAFLEIMKIRMGSRLSFDLAFDPDIGNAPVLPLVLQTLIENAIKHGLEPKSGGGLLTAHATLHNDMIQILVCDDGVGFTGTTAGSGIGLKNIRERLQLIYGDRASVSLHTNTSVGVTAKVLFPFQLNTIALQT